MAIINCPECNEKISSTVRQCIHCGAEVKFCPECKSAYIKNVKNCAKCGFIFRENVTNATHDERQVKISTIMQENVDTNKTVKNAFSAQVTDPPRTLKEWYTNYQNNASREQKTINAKEIMQRWKSESGIRKLYFSKMAKFLIELAALLLCINHVLDIYEFFFPNPDPNAYFYVSAKSITSDIWFACIIFFIPMLIETLLGDFTRINDFSKWLKWKKINNKEIILNSFNTEYGKLVEEEVVAQAKALNFILAAELYSTNDIIRKKHISKFIFDIIANVLIFLFLLPMELISLAVNAEIAQFIYGPDYNFFDCISWIWIIVLVIFIILDICIDIMRGKRINAVTEEWIKDNIPDKMEMYEKYIKNPDMI